MATAHLFMLYTFDELCREVKQTAAVVINTLDRQQMLGRYLTRDAKRTIVGNTFLRLLRVGAIIYDDLTIKRNSYASDTGLLGASDHTKMLQLMERLIDTALADHDDRVKAAWVGNTSSIPLTKKTGNFEGFD